MTTATTAFESARIISIAAFLYFGTVCLLSEQMVMEFERYGLPRMRRLAGGLEVAGALGLLMGYGFPPLTVPASAGLSLMMAFGIGVRFRIKDAAVDLLPATVLLLVNAFICLRALGAFS